MKDKMPSQEHQDNVSRALHRNTIAMTLVIIVFGIILLPSSDPSSAAFVPLVLSMAVSGGTFIWACFSLKKQVKREMERKAEMGMFAHTMTNDMQDDISRRTDV